MSEPAWVALGAMPVDYEGAYAAGKQYVPGDVVRYNGVDYICVNPVLGTAPPAAPLGGLPVTPLVTALPASPFDGQEVILVDVIGAATYSWRLRYVAARASNRWIFVGGAPLFAEVATQEAIPSLGSYVDLPTVGPAVTIPVAGSYIVEIVSTPYQGSGSTEQWMSYAIGATAAVDADGANSYNLGAVGETNYMVRSARKTLAAVTLTAKYKVLSNPASFKHRTMKVTPVAVGG